MNITKGDVQELRRRLKKKECTFDRMCGCYVEMRAAIALRDCPGKKVVAKEKPRTADPVKNGSLCGVL